MGLLSSKRLDLWCSMMIEIQGRDLQRKWRQALSEHRSDAKCVFGVSGPRPVPPAEMPPTTRPPAEYSAPEPLSINSPQRQARSGSFKIASRADCHCGYTFSASSFGQRRMKLIASDRNNRQSATTKAPGRPGRLVKRYNVLSLELLTSHDFAILGPRLRPLSAPYVKNNTV